MNIFSPIMVIIGQKWSFNTTVLVLSLVLWSFGIGYDFGLKRFEETWRKQHVATCKKLMAERTSLQH